MSKKEKVTVFGEQVDGREWKGDAGGVVWGVLLVLIGVVLLLNNVGVVPWNFWEHVWQFWPVILIFIGVHIIMGNNVVSRIVLFFLALVVFGLIAIYGLQQVGSPLFFGLPIEVQQVVDKLY